MSPRTYLLHLALKRRRVAAATALMSVCLSPATSAHTELQAFVRESSGRAINCAMCHEHSDGPEGTGRGQIGGLSPEAMSRLGRARAAFDPGQRVDSPILNDFGDSIVVQLGKKRILELRHQPALLAQELDPANDLDGDGISDAREYLDGTHPLWRSDGHPLRLLKHNLRENAFHIVMIGAATVITMFGLFNLLRGFAATAEGDGDLRSESR